METLLVADSFRVRAGAGLAEARGLDLHLDRFVRSVRAAGGPDPAAFLRRAVVDIAAYGAGFPRLELLRDDRAGFELGLTLRPLPALADTVELRTAAGIAVPHPEVKGPNISRYAALNRELGAEALLVDDAGRIVEGATTSLVWWDGHLLCSAGTRRRVDSVTERLVLGIGAGRGTVERRTLPTPAELARHEVWAVNALHGIRVVTGIDGTPPPEPDERRLGSFREALDRAWEPVAAGG